MNELKQSKLFITRKFKIGEKKLFHTVSKFGNSKEVAISFENINSDLVSEKIAANIFLYFSIFFLVMCSIFFVDMVNGGKSDIVGVSIFLTIGLAILAFYLYTKEEFWKLTLADNQEIYIPKNTPSSLEVSKFIETLILKRNNYLKDNYAIIDENVDYLSQLENLKWLLNLDAITKIEFDELYKDLKTTVRPEKKHIGFGNN